MPVRKQEIKWIRDKIHVNLDNDVVRIKCPWCDISFCDIINEPFYETFWGYCPSCGRRVPQ